MNEGLKKLFEQMGSDESLGEKFEQCKTAEEAYEVALKVADGYTMEEFKEAMKKIANYNNSSENELSEEDLDKVAGGSDLELALGITGAVIGGAGTIIGAAVSASAASM